MDDAPLLRSLKGLNRCTHFGENPCPGEVENPTKHENGEPIPPLDSSFFMPCSPLRVRAHPGNCPRTESNSRLGRSLVILLVFRLLVPFSAPSLRIRFLVESTVEATQ